MLNKKYLLILIIITVIAIFPRIVEVFNPYNFFFNQEQGILYLLTKSIVIDHHIILTAPQGGNPQGGFGDFFKGPGFNYLLAIPFVLTAGDPFGGRLFMLVISILTVSLSFIFANKMFGLRTATLISFLLAISPSLKDYAGNIWPPSVMPLLTVFFLYFLYKGFQKEFKFIPLAVFTVGLMTHFEMATAAVLFLLLTFSGFISLLKKEIPYRYYLFSLIFFVFALLPLFIYDIEHKFHNAKGVIKLITQARTQTINHTNLSILNQIGNRLEVYKWNFMSAFSPNQIIWPLLLIIMTFGIFMILKDKKTPNLKKMYILYLLLILFFTFPVIIFYPGAIALQWWLIYLVVIYCFLFGIILDYFWTKTKLKFLTIIILLTLTIAFLNRTYFIYKTQFVPTPDTYIQENVSLNYIYKDAKGKPFGIIVIARNGQENYDYLIWWNGYEKYHYQPYREKEGLYYILIEPDSLLIMNNEKKLNTLTSGNLVFSKKLPNGFIIEKRLIE
jgi:hypothetical protein